MWIELVKGRDSLRAIFGDRQPSVDHVTMHEVTLHRDGPIATFRFDLAEFPDVPPPKWLASGDNTVQVRISFGSIEDLRVVGWSANCVGSLFVNRNASDHLDVIFNCPTSHIKFTCRDVILDKINAYRK